MCSTILKKFSLKKISYLLLLRLLFVWKHTRNRCRQGFEGNQRAYGKFILDVVRYNRAYHARGINNEFFSSFSPNGSVITERLL